uniref:transketolase C-terminal domain-containing protein n=1 Tax=Oceanivirga salmonicida TaxID=1769291 RepID=UPI000AA21F4E
KIVLVNDAHKTSGYIGEISALISESEAFDYLDAPIRRCAGEDVPMPYAQNLEMAMIPTVESIKDKSKLKSLANFLAAGVALNNFLPIFTTILY